MKLEGVAVRTEALEVKVENMVAESLKIREENVNLKQVLYKSPHAGARFSKEPLIQARCRPYPSCCISLV